MKYCVTCGFEQDSANTICEQCGAELPPYKQDNHATLEDNLALTGSNLQPKLDPPLAPTPLGLSNYDGSQVGEISDSPATEFASPEDNDDGFVREATSDLPINDENLGEIAFGAVEQGGVTSVYVSGDYVVSAPSHEPCKWARCGRVRLDNETFVCAACRQRFCLHHKDRLLPSMCRKCARPRVVAVNMNESLLSGASTLHVASFDLRDDNQIWEYEHNLDFADMGLLLGRDVLEAEAALDPADPGVTLGSALFSRFFPDVPWAEVAEDIARWVENRQGVQFRLMNVPPGLRLWPWELLYSPDGFLSRTPGLSVVRWVESAGMAYPIQSTLPLSILVVAGDPSNPGAVAHAEAAQLSNVLAELIEGDKLIIEAFVPGSDPANELRQKLRSDRFQILHFCGTLAFTGQDDPADVMINGLGAPIDLATLTEAFNRSTVQVVVLTSTITRNDRPISALDPEVEIPEQLLTHSVGALLMTRIPISSETGIELARVFYEALGREERLEEALFEAREHLQNADPTANARSWSLPVLYMRTVDGEGFVLDLEPAESAPEQPLAYQRFVIEEGQDVAAEELPSCAAEALQRLKRHRLQILIGVQDAGLSVLARHLAMVLGREQRALKLLRLPRYEDPGDLLRLLPDLQQAVVLYDVHRLGPVGEEFDRLVRIVSGQPSLYVVLCTSDESARDARSAVGAWLRQHWEYCTTVRPEDYRDGGFLSLRSLLTRLLGDARRSGLIDLKTEQEVLKYAGPAVDDPFGSGVLTLPGQVNRFVFHYLAGSRRATTREKIRLLLEAMDSADDELLRWFADTLTQSQRVLILCFILFQGIPIHMLATLYRAVVDQLRSDFHLDLAVLPIRSEVQQWRLYISEARHPQRGSEDRIVEFVDQEHRNELLRQLRDNYGEWLAELVPLFGSIICGTDRLNGHRLGWSDEEERWVREAIARALGDIAGSSSRNLTMVADQMKQWMLTHWTHITPEAERSLLQMPPARQIMAVPGNTFRQLLEQGGGPREHRQLLDIVSVWWQISDVRIRWAVAAAFSRLAGHIPAARLEPHYRAMIRETQELRQRTVEESRKIVQRPRQEGRPHKQEPIPHSTEQQLRETKSRLRDATEITRSLAHALRGFAHERDLNVLRSAVQLLAGDTDIRVRINTAIALARHAVGQPHGVTDMIEEWCREGNWQRWWTGACTATLLIEQGRVDEHQAEYLWLKLVDGVAAVARTREGSSRREAGNDLAWAMGAAAESGEGSGGPSGLDRSLTLIGRLIGDDPRHDDLFSAVCQAVVAEERRAGESRSRALLARAREWLTTEQYVSQRVRRRLALSLFLSAGQARQRDTYDILKELLRREAFNYTLLLGRPIETLPLTDLGVGGMILLVAREIFAPPAPEGLTLLLATLRQLTMVNDQHIWSVGPFVLCAMAEERTRPEILKELRVWALGPQVPLQFGAIEAAIQLARQKPDLFLEEACQRLLIVARAPRSTKVVERLNERIVEIMDLHNETGREVIALLDGIVVN